MVNRFSLLSFFEVPAWTFWDRKYLVSLLSLLCQVALNPPAMPTILGLPHLKHAYKQVCHLLAEKQSPSAYPLHPSCLTNKDTLVKGALRWVCIKNNPRIISSVLCEAVKNPTADLASWLEDSLYWAWDLVSLGNSDACFSVRHWFTLSDTTWPQNQWSSVRSTSETFWTLWFPRGEAPWLCVCTLRVMALEEEIFGAWSICR